MFRVPTGVRRKCAVNLEPEMAGTKKTQSSVVIVFRQFQASMDISNSSEKFSQSSSNSDEIKLEKQNYGTSRPWLIVCVCV